MHVTMPSSKLMVGVHRGWRLIREGRRYFQRRTPRSNSLGNIKIQKFLSVKLTKAFLKVWTKFKIGSFQGSDVSDRVWFREDFCLKKSCRMIVLSRSEDEGVAKDPTISYEIGCSQPENCNKYESETWFFNKTSNHYKSKCNNYNIVVIWLFNGSKGIITKLFSDFFWEQI